MHFLCLLICLLATDQAEDFRGRQLIAFTSFESFSCSTNGDAFLLTSPRLESKIAWNELVPSWNVVGGPLDSMTVEVKVFQGGAESPWYNLGQWSQDPKAAPRQSVRGQRNDHAHVDTDTLKLTQKVREFQVRLILKQKSPESSSLRLLAFALADREWDSTPLPPNKRAWGKILNVKERSQANYPEGINEWCSPTSISMLLSFWSTNLNRAELDYDVPQVARSVHDPNWPGTGNWPFNTAFAGAHPGIRAYVARLSDVSELEDWVAAGVPVAVSVSYSLLKGQDKPGNGHLVVCIGFDSDGNIVVNDPGRRQVRQVYKRENLVRAWAESENTVYLVYPENWSIPHDRFHHW